MGDIADAMIEGSLCAVCGGTLDGDEPGYQRCCESCDKSGDNHFELQVVRGT